MRYVVGIDLGSTTTKAVVLDEAGNIAGRGITNSRSNYDVACQVALLEALTNTRFSLVGANLARAGVSEAGRRAQLAELERRFRQQQYLAQMVVLRDVTGRLLERDVPLRAQGAAGAAVQDAVGAIIDTMEREADALFAEGASRKSDFFRDLAGSRYLRLAEEQAREGGVPFDQLAGLFDKAILEVENTPAEATSFERHAQTAARLMTRGPAARRVAVVDTDADALAAAVEAAVAVPLEQIGSVGTGYGRQRLPFPEGRIRSEILCHGLGAHAMFPGTRTVLDIGGQDTKAIQVDEAGIVTSFQMNDRCAAGCGRYLGYIADEMNLGLHELGPLASASQKPVRINSTCTVFAGAELRERLSLGEKREDILAGLHRAIILRAMSLLARSGGVSDEFTFTGGVARNEAAVSALAKLVRHNYGDITTNISPDSIYTGALGAALFALREALRQCA